MVLTSEWLSPLVVPLALLAFVGWGRILRGADISVCRADRNVCPPDNPSMQSPTSWGLLPYAAYVVVLWWLFTHRIDRFWIPLLPLLALLAGAGACWTSSGWWRMLLRGLLLAGLGANFLVAAAGPGNAWFVPLEQLRKDSPRWITPWHLFFNDDAAQGGASWRSATRPSST